MLMYDKYTILVKNETSYIGYIKSVSYKKCTFTTTSNAECAKRYTHIAKVNEEIAKLSRFPVSVNNNYQFDIK